MPNLNPHDPDDIIKREKIIVYINYLRFWMFLERQKVLEILLSHKDIFRTYFIFLGLIILISTSFSTSDVDHSVFLAKLKGEGVWRSGRVGVVKIFLSSF